MTTKAKATTTRKNGEELRREFETRIAEELRASFWQAARDSHRTGLRPLYYWYTMGHATIAAESPGDGWEKASPTSIPWVGVDGAVRLFFLTVYDRLPFIPKEYCI
jgi:hypothetical protein